VFEIGNSLHEARARRGVDLNQAELATKIRVKYLRALEDERFDQLPSQTYVKGFLRTYAEYLGLDGQLYVDEFNSRFVAGEEHARVGDARPRRSSVRPERRNRRLELGIVGLVVAVVALVTLVVAAAWNSSGSGAKPPAPTKPHKAKKHVVPRAVPFLQIQAVRGASYVAVHRSSPTGKLLFQGTIDRGRTEPFNGKHFWISLSSPENLRLVVHGKQVPLRGGKPVTLTVTPNGVQSG
jgi:cytoskeletal protein RodZ